MRFDIIVSFRKSLLDDETFHWAYARLIIFAGHKSVQLELVRNQQLRQRFPFLDMLLDDDNWARKLYSLQYLGDFMRFVALVRTVLQGEITQRNVLSGMSIDQGLEMIVDIVTEKAVILHRATRTARSVPRSRDGSFRQFQGIVEQIQSDRKRRKENIFGLLWMPRSKHETQAQIGSGQNCSTHPHFGWQ